MFNRATKKERILNAALDRMAAEIVDLKKLIEELTKQLEQQRKEP